ncbi:1-(5-phosphoribosyl)-5-[(5-phosphoribosylamino)methylideneamino] imidazole-4-carboxamide isomerase [Carboxydochorda subterranea]|uniref:1-(5-phosphoribosyl)-5-[(5-phosphoribosylamino)methylideneamino] imidazole-4-carboxamide isomerase n=1 Tax=Carboxydichorda subterranea TaxID=3109565 RepID=A0ABZ1BV08_9FIRM|nr:1-(5-phosphoribosyl)-5-[(5-phosphoribosylamino)methylideneamino] imidazole-4-carboxamide isomerase [Limnochorda sp. L945t]WRP16366.1 1-(5-phosphoribosyl)-5-[(5-phosphoribosylamino)methylideneamino] imidazole-4-carboxamide isomerase [Limnochorda sp. L945t]
MNDEPFWVVPAIDLMGGHVVRLRAGQFDQVTRYPLEPTEWARRLVQEGASRLHVVDLDGARSGHPVHLEVLRRIASAAGVPVHFGGGLRSLDAVERALAAGASCVMLGTAALRHPEMLQEACRRFGSERVWAAVDVRGGRVTVAGWQEPSHEAPEAVAERLARLGVRWALVTDVAADGTMRGHDPSAALAVAGAGLQVLAAGGIGSPHDVERLAALPALRGAVVGRALYEGALAVREAVDAAARGVKRRSAGLPHHSVS